MEYGKWQMQRVLLAIVYLGARLVIWLRQQQLGFIFFIFA